MTIEIKDKLNRNNKYNVEYFLNERKEAELVIKKIFESIYN